MTEQEATLEMKRRCFTERGGIMNKSICDICGTREADEHFKVKQLTAYDDFSLGFSVYRWTRIDICRSCYEKLRSSKGEQT